MSDQNPHERFLVAVSDGPQAERLIGEAAAIAGRSGVSLTVLHVQRPGRRIEPPSEGLRRLAAAARAAGAEFVTVTDSRPGDGVARFAEENRISIVILGMTRRGLLPALFSPVRGLPGGDRPFRVMFIPTPLEHRREIGYFLPPGVWRFPFLEFALSLAFTAAVTGLNLLLVPFVGYRTIALFYLLFVSFSALFLRVGPVLLAAGLSALLWNYLFIPPLHTLSIARFEDLFMFLVYFVHAALIGGLTARLRVRKRLMQRGERTISALYGLSRELGRSLDRDGIARAAVKCIDDYFGTVTAVLLAAGGAGPDRDAAPSGSSRLEAHRAGTLVVNEAERAEAERTLFAAGPVAAAPAVPALWLIPLRAGSGPAGVLAVRPSPGRESDPESVNFLRGASSLITLALERDAYLRRSEAARVSAESERLYRTLFNLVSHELRTPLTTIKGAASSLTDEAVDGRPETRRALYVEIKQAGDRLNRLLANILSLGRIESGYLKLDRRAHDLRDLAGAALEALEEDECARRVAFDIPESLPAGRFDFEFMRQVFVNLLHNACRYAGPAARISIAAAAAGDELVIRVSDDGPGFPVESGHPVIEKFRRGAGAPGGGLGLGLSICRGIVEAHGGTIAAGNGPAGGAEIVIRLPDCLPAQRERPAGRET